MFVDVYLNDLYLCLYNNLFVGVYCSFSYSYKKKVERN